VKALLLENIHPRAHEIFDAAGIEYETRTGSLGEDELIEALQGIAILGLRSNTNLTARVIENTELTAVGAFCIGTNQIDLTAAAEHAVAAFNAPYSNTRSVVELVIGEIISLARRLQEKSTKMHAGVWDKSAAGSHEVRGRTLGIVGYGNIGSQLSVVAEALGMRVIFYDTADRLAHGNARRMPTFDALLAEADVVTLHVDGRPGNAGLFGAEQFDKMKPRSLFINASRGMVVDNHALRERILSGHIAGAALDVFPVEPKKQGDPFESPLLGLENVILTPHVGGSTQEAQEEIGGFVATKLVSYVQGGATANSVNYPEVLVPNDGSHRFTHLHHSVPGVLAEIVTLLGDADVNISRQQLVTRDELGYAVVDVESPLPEPVREKLAALPSTIELRAL
jgi:D-3-phosphoglycerate dehydrogenase